MRSVAFVKCKDSTIRVRQGDRKLKRRLRCVVVFLSLAGLLQSHQLAEWCVPRLPFSGRHVKPSLRTYVEINGGIFRSLMFTRWRTPVLYRELIEKGNELQSLPYSALKTPIKRIDAMRAGLFRLKELDYLKEYPSVYDRFDAILFWQGKKSQGVKDYITWQKGNVCSFFLEVPEGDDDVEIESKLSMLNHLLRGMLDSPVSSKTCFRFLVVGGGDTRLSRPPMMKFVRNVQRSQYFDKIYYEALDVQLDYVYPMPIGLQDFYVLGIPPGKIEDALKKVDLHGKKGVLAAWGAVYPGLDKLLPWRRDLIDWLNRTDWIQRRYIPMQKWYRELVKYRFYIVPDGNGVCSPKWAEALILQTIPIVPPLTYYKQLRRLGYPMVIVNSWDDITRDKLEVWWKKLSGELEAASWMGTSRCWWSLISAPNMRISDALNRCTPTSL